MKRFVNAEVARDRSPYNAPMTDPPDRADIATEHRLPASRVIDTLDTAAMLQLINDQDALIAGAVRSAIRDMTPVVDVASKASRIIYLGAGTSGRLGVLDASECPPTFFCDPSEVVGIIAGGDSALRKSSEGAEDDPQGAAAQLGALQLTATDLVIGIAAGGSTPYVRGGLTIAKAHHTTTALITCSPINADSHIDHIITLPVGAEVVTGSTRMKAGTATKLALNMITTCAMIQRGKTWGNLMIDLRATNAKLRDRAARIITSQTDLPREEALRLLDATDGRVKIALVMHAKNLDVAAAETLIAQHAGHLRPILGDPR